MSGTDDASTADLLSDALDVAFEDHSGDDVLGDLLDGDEDDSVSQNQIPDDVLERAREDVIAFAEELTTIDGRPVDFSGEYRYMKEPLRAVADPETPRIHMWTMNRGGGKSENAKIPFAWVAITRILQDVLYAVPRSDQLSDFMNLKVGRMFRNSRGEPPILMEMLDSPKIAVKRNQLAPYPEGSGSVIQGRSAWNDGRALQGFHGNFGIADEIQNWTATALENLKEAIDGGMARVLLIGTPDYEGTPYHKHYERSDQREWFVDCPDCGRSQHITLENIALVDTNPKSWERVCIDCSTQLDLDYIIRTGRWESTNPGAPYRSYHWSQLTSPRHDLDEVMRAKNSPNVPEQEFQNFKLARFHSGGSKPIPKSAIYAVGDPDWAMRLNGIPGVAHYAGIDWGGGENADTVVVIGHARERQSDGFPTDAVVDRVERIEYDRRQEELRQVADLLDAFNIGERGRAVADQGFGSAHIDSLQNGDDRIDSIPDHGFGSAVLGHHFGSVGQDQRRWDYLKQERWTLHAYQPPWANRFIDLFPNVSGYDDLSHADLVDYDVSRSNDQHITIPMADRDEDDGFTQDRVDFWESHLTSVKREFTEAEKSGKKREYFTTFSDNQRDDGFYAGVYWLTAMVLGSTSASAGGSFSYGGRAG